MSTPTPTPTPTEFYEIAPKSLEFLEERYKDVSVLGKGGMGCVFKAYDSVLKKWVAIKVLLTPDQNAQAIMRFQQEAKAASRLCHPNIITIYDFGSGPEGQLYLVMELVEGQSLSKFLTERESLEIDEAISLTEELLKALAHAHDKGVTHRDLKPSNIVVSDQGKIYIVDFGIAKISHQDNSQFLTKTGVVMGSPVYMAPEQINLGLVDSRSDLYALGCIFFQLITGKPPFKGNTGLETMNLHVSKKPPKIHEYNQTVENEELESVVEKLLAKDPEDRFQSASSLLEKLESLKDNQFGERSLESEVVSSESGPEKKLWFSLIPYLIVSILLIPIAFLCFQYFPEPKKQATDEAKEFQTKVNEKYGNYDPFSRRKGNSYTLSFGGGESLEKLRKVKNFDGVTELRLERMDDVGKGLDAFSDLPIERLVFDSVSFTPGLNNRISRFKALKYLTIVQSHGLNDFDYSKLNGLDHLSLRYLDIKDKDLEQISKINSLSLLNLVGTVGYSKDGIKALYKSRNLSLVKLGYKAYSYEILETFIQIPTLKNFYLTSINLSPGEIAKLKKIRKDVSITMKE